MASASANSYVHDSSGTYIPATQRPDGSWRKARRVRDGYIPQDEMPLYESKGKQWAKNKPTLPVGLDPKYANAASTIRTIPGLSIANVDGVPSKSSKKKKKKKSESSPKVEEEVISEMNNLSISESSCTQISSPQPLTIDPTKRLRNLKKKIRDINALKAKIESGDLSNPDKDQLEKIARKEIIEAEIEELELELELA